MSILRAKTIEKIFSAYPSYREIDTFIETGTYLAKSIRNMQGVFGCLHTIELSKVLYEDAVEAYGGLDVNFHCGDSKILLPEIAECVRGPVFFYLDAHGFNRPHVSSGFPIWDELDYIGGRDFADIVVIDDMATFGIKAENAESGWAKLTPRAILDRLGPERNAGKMIENNALIILRKAI